MLKVAKRSTLKPNYQDNNSGALNHRQSNIILDL